MTEFEAKFTRALEITDAADIERMYSNPPLWKLYSKFGFNIRPAHFYGFVVNSVLVVPLAIMLALWVYWLTSLSSRFSYMHAWGVWPYVAFSILFVGYGSLRIRAQARKADLPNWSEV